jgi:hypothetical protein
MQNFVQGVALSTIRGKFSPGGVPVPVVMDKVSFASAGEYLGVPALTELHIKYERNTFVLNDCIMSVSMEKNILQTALQGKDGTIKEYISDGDYSINVVAAIAGDLLNATNQNYQISDAYPLAEIKLFTSVLKAKTALEVSSDWLELFGIRSIVIKSYAFEQETHSNRQYVNMSLLSDEPYEIKLIKDA